MFRPAARYPADPRAVFILALSVFSGLTALALNVAPDSLENLLPEWGVILWGALLASGSLVTLAGMARQSVNGIIAEQVGSVMVGVTTLYYSILAIYILGIEVVQSVGIILAWGLACLWRWGQLQALINSSHARGKLRHEQRSMAMHLAEDSIHAQVLLDRLESDEQVAMDARDVVDGTER